MRFTILIHHDGPGYWSEVAGLPGCFASGRTLNELRAALGEAIGLYLWDEPATPPATVLTVGTSEIEIERGD